jgi:hypothetical protein
MLWVRKGIELVADLICPLPSRLSRFASTQASASSNLCRGLSVLFAIEMIDFQAA